MDRPDLSPKGKQATAPDWVLCGTCTRLFSQRGLQDLNAAAGFRHQTHGACQASSAKGCAMCRVLFYHVWQGRNADRSHNGRLVLWNFRLLGSMGPVTGEHLEGIYGLQGRLEPDCNRDVVLIYLFAKRDNAMGQIVHRRIPRRDVSSREVFTAARSLIRTCMAGNGNERLHRKCRLALEGTFPTRVLDVGGLGQPKVRLIIPRPETPGKYLALSYCWGAPAHSAAASHPLQLLEGNCEKLRNGVLLDKLQQSIQDAVTVARELGFRYLWVDALCIIQDNAADKRREIARMADTYKNAAVTIMAASSPSAARGFLSSPGDGPAYQPEFEFCVRTGDGIRGTIYLSAQTYKPHHPLDNRGWALQEFMLSPRKLIFSNYELLWECMETDLRGVTGSGLRYLQPLETLSWSVFNNANNDVANGLASGHGGSESLYLWMTLVHQYTERRLTVSDDRLLALAGITSELQTLWADMNIFGHWKRWFVNLLAWHKDEADRREKRLLHRAPSWSWASVDGRVRYSVVPHVLDATVETLAVSKVTLKCRVLHESKVNVGKLDTVHKLPDLLPPSGAITGRVERRPTRGPVRKGTESFLLLGRIQDNRTEKGVSLIVRDFGQGFRRLGLAVFSDMTLWNAGVQRTVILEPKLEDSRLETQDPNNSCVIA